VSLCVCACAREHASMLNDGAVRCLVNLASVFQEERQKFADTEMSSLRF
jgi:hypothetical protein